MHCTSLQRLATLRLKEAEALCSQGLLNGSYYLAGYAVELSVKAIIAKKIVQHTIPELQLIKDFYSHDFMRLLRIAGLEPELNIKLRSNNAFHKNWSIVRSWSSESRYRDELVLMSQEEWHDFCHQNGAKRWSQELFEEGDKLLDKYHSELENSKARVLLNAITHQQHGVMPWLKTFW